MAVQPCCARALWWLWQHRGEKRSRTGSGPWFRPAAVHLLLLPRDSFISVRVTAVPWLRSLAATGVPCGIAPERSSRLCLTAEGLSPFPQSLLRSHTAHGSPHLLLSPDFIPETSSTARLVPPPPHSRGRASLEPGAFPMLDLVTAVSGH